MRISAATLLRSLLAHMPGLPRSIEGYLHEWTFPSTGVRASGRFPSQTPPMIQFHYSGDGRGHQGAKTRGNFGQAPVDSLLPMGGHRVMDGVKLNDKIIRSRVRHGLRAVGLRGGIDVVVRPGNICHSKEFTSIPGGIEVGGFTVFHWRSSHKIRIRREHLRKDMRLGHFFQRQHSAISRGRSQQQR